MGERVRPTALIADDHAIVSAGLRAALESPGLVTSSGIDVVAVAPDGAAALDALKAHSPDLALLDVQMPGMGGVEVVLEARHWRPKTKLAIYTGVRAPGLLSALVEAGVDGLFSKAAPNEALYENLAVILRGGRFVEPRLQAILEATDGRSALTGRERQTLNLIVQGRNNKEIALALGISAKTVDKHRSSLMQKLDAHSVAQLLSRALAEGLIDSAPEL